MRKFWKILAGIGYWLVSLTWGGILTWLGFLVALFCVVFLKGKIHKNGWTFIVEVGGNWGGLEFGAVALCGQYYNGYYWDEIRCHEFGHSIQNLYLGPLYIFLVWIPSAVRYWYQRFHDVPCGWYQRFWAESNASRVGYDVMMWIEN